jgi:hypothetical protein
MSWRLVGGDPSLGNPSFGFLIQDGPGGSFALTVLGGACTAGLQLPMLCGPFYVPLAPLPVLSTPVQLSDRDCGGMASVALPIPALEALCGLRLCGQWLVLCGATLGTTEAIEFTIGS